MAKRRIWLAEHHHQVFCCRGRPNTCNNLSLLDAEKSPFHDDALIQATGEINEIFTRLREQAPVDHHLALIDTGLGLLLVWAQATDRPDNVRAFVRYESPEDEKAQALGLKDSSPG
jgi:hypothetical protein